jgi:hypothetical protein
LSIEHTGTEISRSPILAPDLSQREVKRANLDIDEAVGRLYHLG